MSKAENLLLSIVSLHYFLPNFNPHIKNLAFSENMIEANKTLSVFGSAPRALWQDIRIIYIILSCALLFVILG